MRLIDAESAIQAIAQLMPSPESADGSSQIDIDNIPACEMCVDAMNVIDEQPTVDAVKVKHGHWEEKQIVDDSTIIETWQSARCSKCGRYHTTPYAYYFDAFNYCPQCGAKMDEVAE